MRNIGDYSNDKRKYKRHKSAYKSMVGLMRKTGRHDFVYRKEDLMGVVANLRSKEILLVFDTNSQYRIKIATDKEQWRAYKEYCKLNSLRLCFGNSISTFKKEVKIVWNLPT